jgi:hypothetical protein
MFGLPSHVCYMQASVSTEHSCTRRLIPVPQVCSLQYEISGELVAKRSAFDNSD